MTNIISHLMSYFALIVAFVQQYNKMAGIGTVMALMLACALVFAIIWTALLILWRTLG